LQVTTTNHIPAVVKLSAIQGKKANLLKNKISQNTSIYCHPVSWQLVSTYKVTIRPYWTALA